MAVTNIRFLFALILRLKQQQRRRLAIIDEIFDLIPLLLMKRKEKRKKMIAILSTILSTASSHRGPIRRTIRRFPRNKGWFEKVWTSYTDNRFKEAFRVTRGTFLYLLAKIRPSLERQTLVEEPISPELRLAVCLYRLGRGDYIYTISELAGLGVSTVCTIINEVCVAIVEKFWNSMVARRFPTEKEDFIHSMTEMEHLWQFPYAFAAVDGCHIPIKCPPGGKESSKEYHNFKEFYSVILMAMVDAKYRFIAGNCGIPGNTHDSLVFQSTTSYDKILRGINKAGLSFFENGCEIKPIVLGDSAFQLRYWLMKPFGNAEPTREQAYFNYRLSRARMIIESAYGQLKGRWRVLMRKCEGEINTVKLMVLACLVLHNACIELDDKGLRSFDLSKDPVTNKERPRDVVRQLLLMKEGQVANNTNLRGAAIRNALKDKFWREHEHGLVC